MGIISDAQASNTGLQIYAWKTSILDSVNNIKALMLSITTQLENMQGNPDYSQEDISEMQTLINELNIAIGLI